VVVAVVQEKAQFPEELRHKHPITVAQVTDTQAEVILEQGNQMVQHQVEAEVALPVQVLTA
jgi:hypothetical protein